MSVESPFTAKKERGAYSTIVFKDGDLYVAEDNVGTVIKEDTDAATSIQAAINAGKKVVLAIGTCAISSSITLPDYTNLSGFGYNTYLKAAAGLNSPILTEAGNGSGNTGLTIEDMRVDGDKTNQTSAFSTLDFDNIQYSTFKNLHVTGGLRTGTYPSVSGDGDGLVLRNSKYNQIIGGVYSENAYDGIKLRNSDYNNISNVICVDNGRAGIQISIQGTDDYPSNYNAISNVIVEHSTGTPHQSSPVTSGIYIHGGNFNIIENAVVYGTRQGFGLWPYSSDNLFGGGVIRNRFADGKASIDIESANCHRNSFGHIIVRGLSGLNGEYIMVTGASHYNKFFSSHFARGDGTGTWTVTNAGNHFSLFDNVLTDMSLTNTGNDPHIYDNVGYP